LLDEDGFQSWRTETVTRRAAPGRVWQPRQAGHTEGIGWPSASPSDDTLVSRIESLLAAGWQKYGRTDHGWLLLPGGLPKTDLPNIFDGHALAALWRW